MREFDSIKDMVYCEIDDISRADRLDMNTVKVLGELVDILKDIGSIEMFEEGFEWQEDDHSYASGYGRGNGYSQRRPMNYGEGGNLRGGRSYGYSRRSRGGYSYDDGKAHMVEELHQLMMKATDQKDKDAIRHLIEQMENG